MTYAVKPIKKEALKKFHSLLNKPDIGIIELLGGVVAYMQDSDDDLEKTLGDAIDGLAIDKLTPPVS